MSFELKEIRSLHFEPTSYCNANCPMCPRTISGGKLNPNLYLDQWNVERLKKCLDSEFLSQLKDVFFCGNFGDPIVCKELKEIWSYLRSLNPEIYLHMHTNGSARNPEWWSELAATVAVGHGSVTFSIDGLQDTNPLYRQNTDFEKIIENARAFIRSGGEARWNFYVFKHNEHQIEEARKLADELGFKRFLVKKTERFFDFSNYELRPNFTVETYGTSLAQLEPASDESHLNDLIKKLSLFSSKAEVEDHFNKLEISCQELHSRRLFISAKGLVLPCGYLNHALFDYQSIYSDCKNEVSKILDLEELNLENNSLKEILDSESYRRVYESWSKKSFAKGKLKVCAVTCGKGFDRIGSQMQNCSGFDKTNQLALKE